MKVLFFLGMPLTLSQMTHLTWQFCTHFKEKNTQKTAVKKKKKKERREEKKKDIPGFYLFKFTLEQLSKHLSIY